MLSKKSSEKSSRLARALDLKVKTEKHYHDFLFSISLFQVANMFDLIFITFVTLVIRSSYLQLKNSAYIFPSMNFLCHILLLFLRNALQQQRKKSH